MGGPEWSGPPPVKLLPIVGVDLALAESKRWKGTGPEGFHGPRVRTDGRGKKSLDWRASC